MVRLFSKKSSSKTRNTNYFGLFKFFSEDLGTPGSGMPISDIDERFNARGLSGG